LILLNFDFKKYKATLKCKSVFGDVKKSCWGQKYRSHASFLFMPVPPAGKIADALERSPDHMHKEDLELPMFDLGTLACATNNFSVENKLGEGGFGSVYKVLIYKESGI
jgi:hypothetical protein